MFCWASPPSFGLNCCGESLRRVPPLPLWLHGPMSPVRTAGGQLVWRAGGSTSSYSQCYTTVSDRSFQNKTYEPSETFNLLIFVDFTRSLYTHLNYHTGDCLPNNNKDDLIQHQVLRSHQHLKLWRSPLNFRSRPGNLRPACLPLHSLQG